MAVVPPPPEPSFVSAPTRRYGLPDPTLSRTRIGRTPIDELERPLAPAPLPVWIGPYRILAELGRGGMGVVYRALDPRTQRQVALKVLPPDRTSETAVARFQREGETGLRLRHPNVVRTYELGRSPEGQWFIAMQAIEGVDLGSQLAYHGRLHPGLASRILAKVAHAVDHAHRQGVLHRDLKPANVIVDAVWHPYLVDFGLAKEREGARQLTTTRSIVGSPAYMAPEATRGGSKHHSPQSDVYGLGATLYALLAGRPPFEASRLSGLIQMIVTLPPVPPSRLVPDIPPALDEVVLRCLAKDPADRPATALDVATALVRSRPTRRVARPRE